ncbi:hypothetical protein UFOVP132_4 [uncultured Caudovirales phage]|uniref:Uncharacterized protein n=1 Tax=uncultured Caudovirales phage TaxID=2100421 RepID=A0A6J5L7P6_9CAUD|nr:hypothetical protein UFOVP132_4 [uncultured Caudovirales phage]
MLKFVIVPAMALALAGCQDMKPSADKVQREQQEQLSMQGVMSVGMPAITRFAEKRMMKDILEMRDQMHPTYTYLAGEQSGVIGEKICDSLGYGLNGATQYTNPQRATNYGDGGGGRGVLSLPQADPNGLFSPAAAEGTWVMCKVPGSDKVLPQYIEPRVIVLTFPKEARK